MVALERLNLYEIVGRKKLTKKYIYLLKIVKNSRHKL